MKLKRLLLTVVLTFIVVLAMSGTAAADWNVGDGHKMHHPQLPDPTGWDINMTGLVDTTAYPLADDFLCTSSGPITDIHFWASVPDDFAIFDLRRITLTIHDDIPAGQSGTGYSMPGAARWAAPIVDHDIVTIDSEEWQSWWNPVTGDIDEPDNHQTYYQFNVNIPEGEAFEQEAGNIYWLSIWAESELNQIAFTGPLGWKTSQDTWNDGAVWWDADNEQWLRLLDPNGGAELALAFVITPEPATLAVLALGGALVMRRRRSV